MTLAEFLQLMVTCEKNQANGEANAEKLYTWMTENNINELPYGWLVAIAKVQYIVHTFQEIEDKLAFEKGIQSISIIVSNLP